MRHLLAIVTFCCALGIASPCKAALIDIGSISLVDFGLGAQILVENTSGGLTFGDDLIEGAFSNLILTVNSNSFVFGEVDGFLDFYSAADPGVTLASLLPGAGISFLNFDPAVTLIDASVTFMFGSRAVQGGGALALHDTPTSLFVDIPENTVPEAVPEPGTLAMLGTGLCVALGRSLKKRQSARAGR